MIDANFNDLSNEVALRVFYNLPLKDIQNVASVCTRFCQLVNSEHFWKNYLPLITPGNVSGKFLEKHGSQLSLRQFALWDIKEPKEVQKLMNHWNSDDKKVALFMLIFSIRSLEKQVFEMEEWKVFREQRNHAHFLVCWGDEEFAFGLATARNAVLDNSKAKEEWKLTKLNQLENIKSFVFQTKDYNNCCQFLNLCTLYLQIESPKELTEFYTELWQKYSPCTLDPIPRLKQRLGNMYTLMPVEVFSGFCNYISTRKEFGSFAWWYLSNEHLQIFNGAFKDCKVNEINVELLPDIKKDTLEGFIELVKNEDLFLKVLVDFLYPEIIESQELFNNFDKEACKNIKRWDIVD